MCTGMKGILKFFVLAIAFVPVASDARAVVSRAARVTNTPTSGYTYNYMYPYLNNQMRKTLNPGNANAQSTSPINAVVRTEALPNNNTETSGARRVVSRSGRIKTSNTSNSGAVGYGANATTTAARAATSGAYATTAQVGTTRRVSPRGATARAARLNSTTSGNVNTTTANSTYVSSSRCLADYTDCMNDYCVRDNTPYNRCYCSSKLSQIESEYQPKIDSLIKRILTVKGSGQWTDAEMTEYWNEKIGQYVGENTWEKLDDALNIDWPDASERMSGQNAYLTGHQYCIQHLTNCAYAAPNMRDVYRSEISRDCATYEQSLERFKTALETALETYQE